MMDMKGVMMDQRAELLRTWLEQELKLSIKTMVPLQRDASFRRYFSVVTDHQRFIAMDAPPELEPVAAFIAISKGLIANGLCAPNVYYQDQAQGFLLLSDFGRRVYCQELTSKTADHLYGDALDDLLLLQRISGIEGMALASFDREAYLFELNNFRHWYLEQYRGLSLTQGEHDVFDALFVDLIDAALAQPQVFTHRDYHSRNLMVLDNGRVGILDFQDALWGPVTYDLVSLLRDCYIDWPQENVTFWAKGFCQQLQARGVIDVDFSQFMRWFDWMGLQRHLKAIFIFARKYLRDQNDSYLEDIPRALQYVKAVVARYPELKDCNRLLELRVFK